VRRERKLPRGAALGLGERREVDREITGRQREVATARRADEQRAGVPIEHRADPGAQRRIIGEPVERDARQVAAQRHVVQPLGELELELVRRAIDHDEADPAPGARGERRCGGAASGVHPAAEHHAHRARWRSCEPALHLCDLRARADDLGQRAIGRRCAVSPVAGGRCAGQPPCDRGVHR
jgi:hypothetical protein